MLSLCALLSAGAHSIGKARCVNFRLRLSPKQDPLLDTDYANELRDICNLNAGAPVNLDPETPGALDNQVRYSSVLYYYCAVHGIAHCSVVLYTYVVKCF